MINNSYLKNQYTMNNLISQHIWEIRNDWRYIHSIINSLNIDMFKILMLTQHWCTIISCRLFVDSFIYKDVRLLKKFSSDELKSNGRHGIKYVDGFSSWRAQQLPWTFFFRCLLFCWLYFMQMKLATQCDTSVWRQKSFLFFFIWHSDRTI